MRKFNPIFIIDSVEVTLDSKSFIMILSQESLIDIKYPSGKKSKVSAPRVGQIIQLSNGERLYISGKDTKGKSHSISCSLLYGSTGSFKLPDTPFSAIAIGSIATTT